MLMLVGLVVSTVVAAPPAAPTYQDLMDPGMFPRPQRGMVVERVERDGDVIRVVTTGADIQMRVAEGVVHFAQRIGHVRQVATLRTGRRWAGATVTHEGPGFARITLQEPRATIRVNGDSLFMLHVDEPLSVGVERHIEPAWHSSHRAHHLIADEWGAFGVYCSEDALDDHYDPYAETVAEYPLPADAVLWVGVGPPKPYDWERSRRDHVVWHWSNTLGYPPDDALRSWQDEGNIVLLQSEIMLWKDWNLDFVPRLGVAEFARVRETIHDLGMRFIVYTSPYAFLKGTDLEPLAVSSFKGFKGWPPGRGTGENMELFMEAITRVMRDLRPDGLYFDGQYLDNPAALYALARRARELIGEEGILEWHSTWALGSRECYLPQADAYVDFVLRGEGQPARYEDLDYLRFFVSGYNIHNSIGVLCNNDPKGYPSTDLTDRLLSVNGRYHTIAGWQDRPEIVRVLRENYRPRLTADLRRHVETSCDARQAEVQAKADSARREREALMRPPEWGEPVVEVAFDEMPAAEAQVSPQSPDALAVVEGALRVRARAHTYAYLRLPVARQVSGLVVKLRLGTDGGMSWGPAALLETTAGTTVRVGVRSDDHVQLDLLGQQLVGSSHGTDQPDRWIWLRVRWLDRMGVVERSPNGEDYERVWSFDHAGALTQGVAALLVGKVPFNGQPHDFSTPGEVGGSEIDLVRLYAAP